MGISFDPCENPVKHPVNTWIALNSRRVFGSSLLVLFGKNQKRRWPEIKKLNRKFNNKKKPSSGSRTVTAFWEKQVSKEVNAPPFAGVKRWANLFI